MDRERSPKGRAAAAQARWSYREYSIFTMPVWAQTEEGLVFYVEAPDGRDFSPINPERLDLFDRITRRARRAITPSPGISTCGAGGC